MIAVPHSSYSALVTQQASNDDNDAKMEPPIQTEYLRSGGAMILIFMVGGAKAVISFCIRSAIPNKKNIEFSIIKLNRFKTNYFFSLEIGLKLY